MKAPVFSIRLAALGLTAALGSATCLSAANPAPSTASGAHPRIAPVEGSESPGSQSTHPSVTPDQTISRPSTDAAIPARASNRKPPASAHPFSPWTTEILKLTQAGVEDGVILSFIDNTAGTFNLDAEQVIRLKDLGVSGEIVSAMVQHDGDIATGWRTVTATTVPGSEPLHLVAATNETSSVNATGSTARERKAAGDNEATAIKMGSDHLASQPASASAELLDRLHAASGIQSAPPASPSSLADGKSIYRVRKPYPEQIMSPVIVLRGWEPPPNTVLISLFPRSSH